MTAGETSPESTARRKGAETYLALRRQILDCHLREVPESADPLAVLVDWPVTHGIASIMAAADGTASIYLSNGGGFIGGGQKHQPIRDAALATVAQAKAIQPQMSETSSYPLPQSGTVAFYVVTHGRVFGAAVSEAELKSANNPFTPLARSAMDIMTRYRLLHTALPSDPIQ